MEELCLSRIKDSLGHAVLYRQVTSSEKIPPRADKKAALINVKKETLKT
jgi:hypothetical protein